jgi:hypothetical protein
VCQNKSTEAIAIAASVDNRTAPLAMPYLLQPNMEPAGPSVSSTYPTMAYPPRVAAKQSLVTRVMPITLETLTLRHKMLAFKV